MSKTPASTPDSRRGVAPNSWDEVPIEPSTFRPHNGPAPESQADGDPRPAAEGNVSGSREDDGRDAKEDK